jgi:phosphoserine phosphatase
MSGRVELVLLDCDSTLSTLEGVDELARRRGVAADIAALTHAAMEGTVPLEDVYARRLELIRPDAEDLVWLGRRYLETLVPGAPELVRALQDDGREVRIVSGGLAQPVVLLARGLGLPQGHTHAVPVLLDEDGRYRGFDRMAPTARAGGKADLVERLAGGRPCVMVGDGVTDLEARSAGARVVGFGGVAARTAVREQADAWVPGPSLLGVLEVVRGWDAAD